MVEEGIVDQYGMKIKEEILIGNSLAEVWAMLNLKNQKSDPVILKNLEGTLHPTFKVIEIAQETHRDSPGIILRKANTDQIYMEGMNLGTKIHIWDQIQGEVHLQAQMMGGCTGTLLQEAGC